MTAFLYLSSLSVSCSCLSNNGFFSALQELHQLTELSFEAKDERDHRVLTDCLSLLTGLESLNLSGSCRSIVSSEIEEQHLDTLTQVKQLSLRHCWLGRCRRFPTAIRSLDFYLSESPPADFVKTLMCMTNLTRLSISTFYHDLRFFHNHGVTPSQFQQELGKLQHLSIQSVLADDSFFDAVGMMTQLTSLVFSYYTVCADIYLVCPRLSNLTELMELEITSGRETCVRNGALPQLRFPKLRKLRLPLSGTDANMQKTLWKTLPCLRKMSLPEKDLDL